MARVRRSPVTKTQKQAAPPHLARPPLPRALMRSKSPACSRQQEDLAATGGHLAHRNDAPSRHHVRRRVNVGPQVRHRDVAGDEGEGGLRAPLGASLSVVVRGQVLTDVLGVLTAPVDHDEQGPVLARIREYVACPDLAAHTHVRARLSRGHQPARVCRGDLMIAKDVLVEQGLRVFDRRRSGLGEAIIKQSVQL